MQNKWGRFLWAWHLLGTCTHDFRLSTNDARKEQSYYTIEPKSWVKLLVRIGEDRDRLHHHHLCKRSRQVGFSSHRCCQHPAKFLL